MPVTLVSNTTPTVIYTAHQSSKEFPDQLVFRAAKGSTNSIAVLDTNRGDTTFNQGFYIDPGETFGVNLISGETVTLIALTAPTNVVWYVQGP